MPKIEFRNFLKYLALTPPHSGFPKFVTQLLEISSSL